MMTSKEIIELLQKIKYDEKGHSTNLEYYSTACNEWYPVAEDLASTLHDISEGVEYRIKPEPKYEPYTHDDAELFLGKMFRFKKNKKLYLVVDTDWATVTFGNKVASDYKHLLENYTHLDGSPAGRLV